MVGRTNVGGGGSTFSATLQITTDANATIVAVNPAGNRFTGTANSSGSLSLTINKPGTYTVTATSGSTSASGTVAVADNEGTVAFTLYTWNGQLYYRGNEYEEYTGGWIASNSYIYNPYSKTGTTATLEKGSSSMVAEWDLASLSRVAYHYATGVRITDTFDITDYDTLTIVYEGSTPDQSSSQTARVSLFICSSDGSSTQVTTLTSITSGETTATLDISSYSGSYYIGVSFLDVQNQYSASTVDQIVTIHSVVCS